MQLEVFDCIRFRPTALAGSIVFGSLDGSGFRACGKRSKREIVGPTLGPKLIQPKLSPPSLSSARSGGICECLGML